MPFIDQQEEFYKPEILVDFGYNRSRSGFQAEALAYSPSGTPIKSIAPKTPGYLGQLNRNILNFI